MALRSAAQSTRCKAQGQVVQRRCCAIVLFFEVYKIMICEYYEGDGICGLSSGWSCEFHTQNRYCSVIDGEMEKIMYHDKNSETKSFVVGAYEEKQWMTIQKIRFAEKASDAVGTIMRRELGDMYRDVYRCGPTVIIDGLAELQIALDKMIAMYGDEMFRETYERKQRANNLLKER